MLIEKPTDWQRGLLTHPEWVNLGVFGGRGAGRTTGALFIAMRHCELHSHGAHVLFIRQMLRSLREVEDALHLTLAAQYGDALRVNRQDHIFTLPSGATIEFSPINDTEDMAKLQGRNFSLVIADEYGNFSPQQMRFVDQLRANMRAGKIHTRFVLLANPGGRGHQMIKERFIDRSIAGQVGVMNDGLPWCIVKANYLVNPHNPVNYISSLRASALGDAELLKAWEDGDWNIARGAMFQDVIDETAQKVSHAWVLDLLKKHSRKGVYSFLSGDWGQSAPAVCFDCVKFLQPYDRFPRNSIVLLDEISSSNPDNRSQGMNWSIGRFAEEIEEMVVRNGSNRVGTLDDMKGLQPEDTLIKQMGAYNFSFQRPKKNRTSGWAAQREYLFNSHEKNGKPGLWISERCQGWWETVPLLPRDPSKPEDVDTRAIDHWADATRYACVYEVSEVRYNNASVTSKRYPSAAGPMAPLFG